MADEEEGTIDLAAERHERVERKLAKLKELEPTWAEMFDRYVERGMYKREVLDQKTRELCAVAALTVLDRQGVLGSHIKAAMQHGARRQEVLEVLFQMSVYGGFPVTLAAIETYRNVMDEIRR